MMRLRRLNRRRMPRRLRALKVAVRTCNLRRSECGRLLTANDTPPSAMKLQRMGHPLLLCIRMWGEGRWVRLGSSLRV